jgi:hypothetical protein
MESQCIIVLVWWKLEASGTKYSTTLVKQVPVAQIKATLVEAYKLSHPKPIYKPNSKE